MLDASAADPLRHIRGSGTESSRFGELVAEERMRCDFGVFASRAEARAWLAS